MPYHSEYDEEEDVVECWQGGSMGFLAKLFTRTKNARLNRSQSDPLGVSASSPQVSLSSEESDEDDVAGVCLEYEPQVGRRVACELRRSRSLTRVELQLGQLRSSMSSVTSDACSDDSLHSQYTKLRLIHRGRHAVILQATDRKTRRLVILKAFPVPDGRPSSGVTLDGALRESALLVRLAGGKLPEVIAESAAAALLSQSPVGSGSIPGGRCSIAGGSARSMDRRSASINRAASAALATIGGVAEGVVPGVVRSLATIHSNEQIYLVLDHVPGNTLIELMANRGGRLPELTCCVEVALPLLVTLASLHAAGVVHRQLKPEHVLCHGGTTRLIDFFFAADKRSQHLNQRVGTLEYMAPEVLSKPLPQDLFHVVLEQGISEEELPTYDERADIWSLGVVVYEALTGCQPFVAEDAADMQRVQHAALACESLGGNAMPEFIARHRQLSPSAQDFLRLALRLDAQVRSTAPQLLEHPWLAPHVAAHAALLNFNGRASRVPTTRTPSQGSRHSSAGENSPRVSLQMARLAATAAASANNCSSVSVPIGESASARLMLTAALLAA